MQGKSLHLKLVVWNLLLNNFKTFLFWLRKNNSFTLILTVFLKILTKTTDCPEFNTGDFILTILQPSFLNTISSSSNRNINYINNKSIRPSFSHLHPHHYTNFVMSINDSKVLFGFFTISHHIHSLELLLSHCCYVELHKWGFFPVLGEEGVCWYKWWIYVWLQIMISRVGRSLSRAMLYW